jgi:hypothetical protein
MRIPADADPGEHMLSVQADGSPPVEIGVIEVEAVERLFERPALDREVGARFGPTIRLAGLSADGGEEEFTITLVWESEGDISTSYTAFIHALDGQENIIGQSDTTPAEGARPTTGWLPGEVILDMHRLAVEPGMVSALRVGLYDASSGVRVRLDDGSDAVAVPYPLADHDQ